MSVLGRAAARPESSPCVGRCSHCVGDAICRGCGRTIEEVRDWNSYGVDQKIAVKQLCAQRKREP